MNRKKLEQVYCYTFSLILINWLAAAKRKPGSMPQLSGFELQLLGIIFLLTPVFSKFAFTALNESASDMDKSSVSLFFFSVHSPVAKYLPTSKMVSICATYSATERLMCQPWLYFCDQVTNFKRVC